MAFSPEQTTRWVEGVISDLSEVQKTEVVEPNVLRVSRKGHPAFEAAIISHAVVTAEIVRSILTDFPGVSMVVNIPKDSYWQPSAVRHAISHGVAFGGLGDLKSAIEQGIEDVSQYVRREFQFVERGLRQHSRVASFKREDERLYTVHRRGFLPLRFVVLNEYELTGEHVRTARDRYGTFQVILVNNPNGQPTAQAYEVAKDLKIDIFFWSEFLGRLNRR